MPTNQSLSKGFKKKYSHKPPESSPDKPAIYRYCMIIQVPRSRSFVKYFGCFADVCVV